MHLRRRSLRTLVSAVALTVAAAVAPTVATATPAHAAGVTSGWNDTSCKPSAAHPRPVVLVHGTMENKTNNWWSLAPYLVDRGYCVFSFDYGQLPGVPVFYGLGPVDKGAEQLSTFVDKVLADTGASKVDLVGHSQGGMMPRYYLKFLGGAPKVGTLVGLAPNNHGTTMSGLTKLLDIVPGARDAITGVAPGLTDQVVDSPFMRKLNEGGDTVPGVNYTVIATRYDEVVTPHTSQFLTGPNVKNILIQDRCAVDISMHLTLGTIDRVAFHETANALDPANATPSSCASMVS
ncbi:esterase/lipase family protein [Streptomyces albireticuli]|uniref:Lipase n=1 Tax=Streptomyces albireticuli TaxID=1940 RepID=A0A2A2D351_9ACTN|nr:alpha/beta fold hydrolase [Streptomyces albireticuli]MCD9143511.1 alpha/beta fold hydrolase [Streptomyces albireticuli]MCD9164870.1 alpha/beta fold hydrolase [Streptomyces albireticuli]MCD9191628.1 alpha/beta fold hydrolase [Streptomyces albireticuli]PAU45760.1 lipase [Streptomyces albireticuli]